jgi:hypothetical protein
MRTLLYLEIYARRVFTVDIADLHGTTPYALASRRANHGSRGNVSFVETG